MLGNYRANIRMANKIPFDCIAINVFFEQQLENVHFLSAPQIGSVDLIENCFYKYFLENVSVWWTNMSLYSGLSTKVASCW